MNRHDQFKAVGMLLGLLIFMGGSISCSTRDRLPARVPAYQPSNVSVNRIAMEPVVQRVAVLPVQFVGGPAQKVETAGMLTELYQRELVKRAAFDSYFVTQEQLLQLTGSSEWKLGEPLSLDFIEAIQDTYYCQAVLFCSVNHFHPYPPQTVAWRMKLVHTESQETIWEVDEFFDAGDVTVAQAAREYFALNHTGGARHLDERSLFSSPRRFGQYAIAAVLGTLPY